MRLRLILTPTVVRPVLAAACLMFAGPVAAQQAQPARDGQALGLRYLTWSGKTDVAAPATATPPVPGSRRPAAIIPRRSSGAADAPSPQARETRYGPAPSNGLTPARAWLSAAPRAAAPTPLPMPAYAAAVEPTPPPVYRPFTLPAPSPMPPSPAPAPPPAAFAPAPAVADPMAPRRDAPIFRMQSRAAPEASAVTPAAPSEATPQAVDPMAPRRDAPIFRIQSAAPSPAAAPEQPSPAPAYASADQPARDGARYYSVHRAAGRKPDATAMPASVYLDHVPLNLTDTPTSTDLAEPPAAPPVTRTINGRAQVITPNEDPSLP